MKRSLGLWLGMILFTVFAALQVNDIDPDIYETPSSLDALIWVFTYLLVSLSFFGVWKGWPVKWLMRGAVLVLLIQLVMAAPGLISNLSGEGEMILEGAKMSPQQPEIETSREFLGAVIGLLGLFVVKILKTKPLQK